jgi:hypothetical protein
LFAVLGSKAESSFSEEKEAKRLWSFQRSLVAGKPQNSQKFLVLFS